MILYDVVKSAWCGKMYDAKVGVPVYTSYTDVNEAFQAINAYNQSECGCRVEVKEREVGQ